MARIVFIHNEHDKASRDLLDEVRLAHPEVEVVYFMDARESIRFQGAPAVYIVPDEAPQLAGQVCWRKEIDVTNEDIEKALVENTVPDPTINVQIMPAPPEVSELIASLTARLEVAESKLAIIEVSPKP